MNGARRALAMVSVLAVGLLTVGCGNDDAGTAGSGGFPGAGGAGGGGGSGVETVTLTLTVLDFTPNQVFPPVAGAEVCVVDSSECATTDADGKAEVELPSNTESAVTVEAVDYQATLSPQSAGSSDIANETLILSETLAQALAASLGASYPLDGTGAFNLAIVGDPPMVGINGIAGNTITMADPQGIQFYTTESSLVSTELTETTAPLGSGGYIEVSPGTYEVEYGGGVTSCRSISAWAGSDDGSLRLPVRDGYITFSWVSCME